MENMNPIEDGDGHLVPLNMVELGAEPPPAPPPPPVENQTPAEEPQPSSGNGTRHKVREVEDGH
jgi:hypothetical protein